MKMQKMLKRAAAAASGVIVLSSATSMATADSSATEEKTAVTATAAESTTAAETEAASAETVDKADNEQKMPEDWAKADVSDYDSSLTLISYEIATPEMAKVGGTVDPLAGLSEEERKALEETIAKKKSALQKGTPTLSKNAAKSRSKEPTAVELKTSGAFVGDIPDAQPNPEVDAKPGQFAFVTYGWGHGVGMSQNGANFYAAYAGWTYQDILFHYYPGTYLMNTDRKSVV